MADRSVTLFEFDEKLKTQYNVSVIAGADEVGRGCLAGPVMVCCVIMDLSKIVPGVDDSKKLSRLKREKLYSQIIDSSLCYNFGAADVSEIQTLNILGATRLAFKRAIEGMAMRPQLAAVDAISGLDIDLRCVPIVKGDSTSYSIACASILAKVKRDELMDEYALSFPEYGFEKHKGYGTRYHRQQLLAHGACELHRSLFLRKITG